MVLEAAVAVDIPEIDGIIRDGSSVAHLRPTSREFSGIVRCECVEVFGRSAALVCKIPRDRRLLCRDPSLTPGHYQMGWENSDKIVPSLLRLMQQQPSTLVGLG